MSSRASGPKSRKKKKASRGKAHHTLLELCCARFPERERRQLYAAILCGEVFLNGTRERNPKQYVAPGDELTLELRQQGGASGGQLSAEGRYVSRGGEKLEAALQEFALDPAGLCVVDAGASTGGFTDCLLQHGAACVHAVDVGYNQLAYKLRNHHAVRVHERVNIRSVTQLDPVPDFAVADLSFRSLRGVAGQLIMLTQRGVLLALLKPQFEREYLAQDHSSGEAGEQSFEGVVTTAAEVSSIACGTVSALEQEGAFTAGVSLSPLKGRSGNRELFLLLTNKAHHALAAAEFRQRLETLLADGLPK